MEWTESLQSAIRFMEAHLLEDIRAEDVAAAVHISPFYLQKGFTMLTGCSMAEYLRNRRLYLAAIELAAGKSSVIELAYKYGYDTPESFSKAFSRFHGFPPAQLKGDTRRIRVFLPLRLKVTLQGGNEMDYTVQAKQPITLIGFERTFSFGTSYGEIPPFWKEFSKTYCAPMMAGKAPETAIEKAIVANNIGEYGVCIDDKKDGETFRYLIAGEYHGGEVPEGMTKVTLPAMDWAIFRAVGPMPGSLQTVNTEIFQSWLPNNGIFETAADITMEWYSMGDMNAADYESAVWVPVKKK